MNELFDVRFCCEGNRALEYIKNFKPDIVCLDLTLPGLDGLSILENTVNCGINPVVLVITSYLSEYVIQSLNRLGISFIMRKPCAASVVAQRLVDIMNQNKVAYNNPMANGDPVVNILKAFGFRLKGKNACCTIELIRLCLENPSWAITKVLYPTVASKCGGNAARIEKVLRDAITYAWQNNDNVYWKRFFPEHCKSGERPSNGDFIQVITAAFASENVATLLSPIYEEQRYEEPHSEYAVKDVIA